MTFASLLRRNARTVNSASSGLSSTSRISTSLDMDDLIIGYGVCCANLCRSNRTPLCDTQREKECRSSVKLRFRPDSPAVLPNDTLHNRQPYSRAFEIAGLMQPLENAKQLARVLHLEARAIVLDEYDALTVLHRLSHLNHRPLLSAGVLHGIRKQIDEHLLDESRIAVSAGKTRNLPFNFSPRVLRR